MENNSYIVAIDLGSGSVKVAAGTREPDGKLNVLDAVVKPVEGMAAGEILNIEQVTTATRLAVEELEAHLGIKVTEGYVGVSGQDIKCAESSYFVYVAGEDGEIRETDVAKLHESMNNLQPPEGVTILDRIPQKYIIDQHEDTLLPVGRFGHQLEAYFNFVVGSRATMDRMAKAFTRLGIKPLKIYTNAQASAAAVLTDDERELGAAVIDIGAGTSDICIWQENKLRHVGVIPVGSDAINRDIRSQAIPDRFIEKLKITHGYAMGSRIPEEKRNQTIKIKGRTPRETKEMSFHNLAQIIEARLTDIIEHAVEEIKDAGYTEKLGSGIVLTGGGAMLREIAMLFRERTKYDVRIGGTEHTLVSRESYDYTDSPRFSTVTGLLLLGLKDSDIPVTTHPQNRRRRHVEEEEGFDDGYTVRGDGNRPVGGRGAGDYRDARDGRGDTGSYGRGDGHNAGGQGGNKGGGNNGKGGDKPPKKGWFKKIFTGVFEVVDDEEI